MKAWLPEEDSWPSIVNLFKGIGHCRLVGAMGHCYRRLKKKPILEKLNVITNGISIKDLKAIVNLLTVIIYKSLKSRHHVNLRKKTIP